MFFLYLFAMLVGGVLLLSSMFGSDSDTGHAVDAGNPVQWLSVRTVIYFLFVFGGVGAVLTRSWPAGAWPLILVVAAVAGVGVGGAVSAAFGYLQRSGSGDRDSDESFVGLTGTVTLPIGRSGTGKVFVTRGDRTFELLARPLDRADGDPSRWRSVVVVEMKQGIAIVAPSDDPAVRELSTLNP